jgi:hypothetical protein
LLFDNLGTSFSHELINDSSFKLYSLPYEPNDFNLRKNLTTKSTEDICNEIDSKKLFMIMDKESESPDKIPVKIQAFLNNTTPMKLSGLEKNTTQISFDTNTKSSENMGTYSKKSNNSSLTSYSVDGSKEQALRKKLDDDLCNSIYCILNNINIFINNL